ncbi:unnamed protein product [Microthlaspi erraticum]|uniref:Uncharacterized protein n=1 Tax=Microthlaspi erraticum TaxID=1685480 RepID=A0A6D2JV46_9BRAS|nr:unnamed protein product [Microthlaspi erraticum]
MTYIEISSTNLVFYASGEVWEHLTSGLRLPSQNGQVGSGKEFPWPLKFGSFLFVSSCIKVLVKLKEEFSNRLARLCRDLICRPYCLRAIGQNELLRLSHEP